MDFIGRNEITNSMIASSFMQPNSQLLGHSQIEEMMEERPRGKSSNMKKI